MLISYHKLHSLITQGVITADPALVNGASIDLTLGADLMVQAPSGPVIDLAAKKGLRMRGFKMNEYGYEMIPGEFLLAHSNEVFNLPDNIAAEFKLKSSMARNGLNHLLAGWCDPGFNNSQLTLEFHNCSNQTLLIKPNMKCGQIVLWECEDAGEGSYRHKGQYNGQKGATESKGVR